jgi:hypothetical protein
MDETLLSAIVDTDPDYYSEVEDKMEPSFTIKSNHKRVEDRYRIKVTLRPYALDVV